MLTLKYIMKVRRFLDQTEGYVPKHTNLGRGGVKLRLTYYENPRTGDVVIAPRSGEMLRLGFKELPDSRNRHSKVERTCQSD